MCKDACEGMLTAALFTTGKNWRQPTSPVTGDWLNKWWYICTRQPFRKWFLSMFINVCETQWHSMGQEAGCRVMELVLFTCVGIHMCTRSWSCSCVWEFTSARGAGLVRVCGSSHVHEDARWSVNDRGLCGVEVKGFAFLFTWFELLKIITIFL